MDDKHNLTGLKKIARKGKSIVRKLRAKNRRFLTEIKRLKVQDFAYLSQKEPRMYGDVGSREWMNYVFKLLNEPKIVTMRDLYFWTNIDSLSKCFKNKSGECEEEITLGTAAMVPTPYSPLADISSLSSSMARATVSGNDPSKPTSRWIGAWNRKGPSNRLKTFIHFRIL